MKKIYEIFRQNKSKLILIYLFMLVVELSILSQPFLLGKSIDGLISRDFKWVVFLGLSYFISAFFNYKRMIYDTKVYTKIYTDIVFKFLKKTDIDNSTKVARTDMAHEIVNVLEGYVHYYIATIVTIIGSIGFIYLANFNVGLLVSISFVLITLSVLVFYKKIRQAINVTNNHYENKVKSIEQGFTQSFSFFNRRRRLEIISSNLQGKNWFLISIVKYVFLLLAIIILVTSSKNITVGGVITIYEYVNNFLISLMSIPIAFEMFSRLSNIIKRI